MFSSVVYSPGIPVPLVFNAAVAVDREKENDKSLSSEIEAVSLTMGVP